MIRILLADGKATTRKGLALLLGLDPDLQVIGEAQDGGQTVMLAEALCPDVILIGVGLQDRDSFAVTEQLAQLCPGMAVIILATHADAETEARALGAGAVACLEKRLPAENLLAIIKSVVPGTTHTC